jgi:hypothetical protein
MNNQTKKSKLLPTRQYCFNSRASPITDITDNKRSTIQCDLGKDAFRVPDDQDCLMSVITAEIPMQNFTFDTVPTFQIYNAVTTSTQTFGGINTTTAYTVATLITALNNTTYTHNAQTVTLTVTQAAGTNCLTFTLAGTGSPFSFIFNSNIPQLGINAVFNKNNGSQFPSPFTPPSSPLLVPKYYIVRSPDMQTMYSQPIAKIQTDLTYLSNTIYYKNFSSFDTRVLSPFIQNFQLQLTDEDGNPIHLRGADWSINVQFKFIQKQNLEVM